MSEGRVTNLGRALFVTGVACIVCAAGETLFASTGGWHPILVTLGLGLALAAVLVPWAIHRDRTLADLQRHIERSGASEPVPVYYGARWLRPLTRAAQATIERVRNREEQLKSELRDLKVRHRVSEAERRQIEAVLNSLHDPVLVTDPFDELVMANRSAAKALGFALDAAQNRPLEHVIPDSSLCRIIADTREHGDAQVCRQIEHQVDGSDAAHRGTVFNVAMTCVEDPRHEVAGVVTVMHDLTREHELAQLKSDFVSKASHELRTPLSSIRAYVEMLVDGEIKDDATRREFHQIIQTEANRLGRLIDNLLDLSQIEAGTVDVRPVRVPVRELVQRSVDMIAPQAKAKDLTIELQADDPDLVFEVDQDMLQQVMINLLSNAVKYTPPGGAITVVANEVELSRQIELTVSDTGVGIPPGPLPRLFDKFYRVEDCKHMAPGSGLGLSLCRHIIEFVHRGRIGIESEVGVGTTARVVLPVSFGGPHGADQDSGGTP